MSLKLINCKTTEVGKAIEIMCESKEWDDWKQKYLGNNWNDVIQTFKKIIKSRGELGLGERVYYLDVQE